MKLVHGAVARLKNAPRIAIALGCLVAGFLIGLLVFVEPWQLNPDLGDLPTWLLVLLAAVAGWVGFDQLRLLRRQLEDEQLRNVDRDKLIDKQLGEAERRAIADRRTQAEGVEVTWARDLGSLTGIVENNSRRPISRISCMVMSNVDRKALRIPDKCGERHAMHGNRGGTMYFVPDMKPLQTFETLRPQATCIFVFDGLTREPDQVFVTWFTDDAGYRWQLDEYLHLVMVDDGDESEYRQ